MQIWGDYTPLTYEQMFEIINSKKASTQDNDYISMMDNFIEMLNEMRNQNIPNIDADLAFQGFMRNPETIPNMISWLVEHRNINYGSFELTQKRIELVGHGELPPFPESKEK